MRGFQVQQALQDGQQLDRDWRAAHLEDRAASVTARLAPSKVDELCHCERDTPCEGQLTLLKRDEKTS